MGSDEPERRKKHKHKDKDKKKKKHKEKYKHEEQKKRRREEESDDEGGVPEEGGQGLQQADVTAPRADADAREKEKDKKKKKRKMREAERAGDAERPAAGGRPAVAADGGGGGGESLAAASGKDDDNYEQDEEEARAARKAAKAAKKAAKRAAAAAAAAAAVAAVAGSDETDDAPAARVRHEPDENDDREDKKDKKEKKKRRRQQEAEAADDGAGPSDTAVLPAGQPPAAAAPAPAAKKTKKTKEAADGGDLTWTADFKRSDVKHGTFSSAEKEALLAEAKSYAAANGLPDDLQWLFDVRSVGRRGAVKVIAKALPNRKVKASWACLLRLVRPAEPNKPWREEHDATLLSLVESKGKKWKAIGQELGRRPEDCRDRWRTVMHGTSNVRGGWKDEEVAKLDGLVKEYLALKKSVSAAAEAAEKEREEEEAAAAAATASTGRKRRAGSAAAAAASPDGGGGLRVRPNPMDIDGVNWEWVAKQMGSRNPSQCRAKWYHYLAPSMVETGEWASGDDNRMLSALLTCGAVAEYEVDWGSLVPGRPADAAWRRWRLMIKMLPAGKSAAEMAFTEIVEYLVDNFCPKLKLKVLAAAGGSGGDQAAAGGGGVGSGSGSGGEESD